MKFTPKPFLDVCLQCDTAWISLNRPPNNAINPAIAHSLKTMLSDIVRDQRIDSIVLSGSGKCFAAGADLAFFARQADAEDFHRIEQFSAQLHALCNFIAASPKPIIAVAGGNTLGAGLELALACHRIIVNRTTTLGLPETGLGICPGSGGTQRLPRRIDPGLAKWMIYNGAMLSGKVAEKLGVADHCLVEGDFDLGIVNQVANVILQNRKRPAPPQEYQVLAQVFSQFSVAELLQLASQESMPSPWDGRTRRAVKSLLKRPRCALLLAERLIEEGSQLPLNEALKLEIAAQREMFENADAREGLKAALASQNPIS
ncbi:putative enoyl-CoA hydratase [Novipirellula aureliae]|uniref:Putative enoyl-CoA hydratase n=1 Tax=Novipirellula aureliae TaxID=2527966 RepID=A0A5C6DD76_9BACT|nr:enoyl-CoA hydratase/isomerase family protein [Novipirellula aureliae]TWU33641.1 putative enoyl-CoA hydratase [Novipirellula aureliae]